MVSNIHKNAKLKVVFIYRGKLSDVRGTPIKVLNLFREFTKRTDIEPTFFTWDDEGSLGFPNILLTNDHLNDIRKIYAFVKKNNVDVVVGHTMATYYYLVPIKLFTSSKIILEMQGFMEEESKLYNDISKIRYFFSKIIYGIFYRMCDLIIASSKTGADILRYYNKNVYHVWGGVDTSIFNPAVTSGNFLKKKSNEIVIGYAGNARIWQGLPFLIEAFTDLRKIDSRYKLVLLSSEKKILKHKGIVYIKPIEHNKVPLFYADCDILVIPRMGDEVSRISFPTKIVEYMAMGKATVASMTSDAHKIITNGKDGFVFEPGNKREFIDILLKLQDKDLRNQLGVAAVHTIQNGYTWEHQAENIIYLIKNKT